jgi:predicted cupin superfamily sugar epimerase
MDARAATLIEQLQLQPHPEGGFFREVHRSRALVQPAGGRSSRHAMTSIYFLLLTGSYSRWHRVLSDEVWHWYEGGPVELLLASPEMSEFVTLELGPVGAGCAPIQIVSAGWWQAARPRRSYALMGCTVAPGFEFADFAFLNACAAPKIALEQRRPEWAALL